MLTGSVKSIWSFYPVNLSFYTWVFRVSVSIVSWSVILLHTVILNSTVRSIFLSYVTVYYDTLTNRKLLFLVKATSKLSGRHHPHPVLVRFCPDFPESFVWCLSGVRFLITFLKKCLNAPTKSKASHTRANVRLAKIILSVLDTWHLCRPRNSSCISIIPYESRDLISRPYHMVKKREKISFMLI